MDAMMEFASRQAFRDWLSGNCQSSGGVWLLFGKAGGPETVKAGEALEEALCFGWIDGQMKSIDSKTYKKYFAPRRANSKWYKTIYRKQKIQNSRELPCYCRVGKTIP